MVIPRCFCSYTTALFIVFCEYSRARMPNRVRSECLACAFRASCCSARLFRVPIPLSGTGKKKGGSNGGIACTGGYKGVRAVRPESVAGGGWFEVLWNLECPVGLSQKRNMCAFHWRKFGANWTVRRKNKELWSYVVKFEFSRPKSRSNAINSVL